MELQEAKRLIQDGESTTVEFKRKIRHPEKVIKELVAFANTKGGYLFIGVSDDGTINGVRYPEDEIFALNKAIDQFCRPTLPFDIETHRISEHQTLIIYTVPSSDKKPHYVINKEENPGKQAFVRLDDKSIKASQQLSEIIERRRKQKNIKFTFGDKEKWLMEYLEKHDSITLSEFSQLRKINNFQASRGLILMVLANILEILPSEKEDRYTLKI